MSLEFLQPVSERLQDLASNLSKGSIGRRVTFYRYLEELDLKKYQLAIIGVEENRDSENSPRDFAEFDVVREKFYRLFSGAWSQNIIDLGNILPGDTVEDTYYLFNSVLQQCHLSGVTPCVLGGGQDLLYTAYRSLDDRPKMVSVCNVDAQFDLGNIDAPLNAQNHIGKMVVDQPYHLMNYINLGYQTYYNAQDEIALLEQLHFESIRLGELDRDVGVCEPFLRSADILSIDVNSLDYASSAFAKAYPNGITAKQLCSITRYAGMGESCGFLGFFNIPEAYTLQGCEVISQAIWYFIEGKELRIKENPDEQDKQFISYTVLTEPETLTFLKSRVTDRWWIKVIKNDELHNNRNHHAFIACSQDDYKAAIQGVIPERWFRARRKLDI
jgi:hypothetical protein